MTKLLFWLERNRLKVYNVLLYAMLIPFLRPRGFDEVWGWYKTFFTLWLYLAMVGILAWAVYDVFHNGLRYKACAYAVAAYYILFVVITLVQQKGIHEGTQKMFAAPALYIFCMLGLKTEPRKFLIAVVNVITVIFALSVTVFCPIVTNFLINIYHVNFLGHVQVAAQYGILACLAAYLLVKVDHRMKRRSILLVVLALVQTVWAGTAAGLLMIMLLVGGVFLRSHPKLRFLTLLNPQFYYACFVIINACVMVFSFTGLDMGLGIDISFSGRTEVWRESFKLIMEHPILGYGAYGAQIVTSWSEGMNYAHNEFVQRLLDGGIVLCVAYIVMLSVFVQSFQRLRSRKVRSVLNICFACMLLVMLFESVTDYYFVAFFFVLLAYTPEILAYKLDRWSGDET